MADKNPVGREKHHVDGQGSVNKRGSGLGTGPVGKTDGRTSSTGGSSSGSRAAGSAEGRPIKLPGKIGAIVAVIVALIGGKFGLDGFLGGGGSGDPLNGGQVPDQYKAESTTYKDVDTSVAAGARDKRTTIVGNGKDTITIMVYMCGTDLESKYGMATADLNEMKAATISDKINIIVYTGGCKAWKDSKISNKKNQIYQVKSGQLILLEDDMGSGPMTDPANLTAFIKYCNKNYPANRNELIFWDHGGGSLSGYGYDEKNSSYGSMKLGSIDTALKDAGVTFDFIGFDACLMATTENALMLTKYGDYLIASEETEPGVGWYYTDWLNALSKDTSMATVDIGKNIIDSFVETCDKKCKGQKTTLSIIDLAELEATVPADLTAFAKSTNNLIQNKDYKTVADARYYTREFAISSKIDQVDLVNLANNIGTKEAKDLAQSVQGAIKYNRTSSNMTNAYGISIYFPYKSTSKVNSAVSTYNKIGMDSEYSKCIQEFAGLEASGQIATGGMDTGAAGGSSQSILDALLGSTASSNGGSSADISSLISSVLGSDMFSGKSMTADDAADYIVDNMFDPSNLTWEDDNGKTVITLSDDQWDLVNAIELNVFVDDGEGYIDLGLDNTFTLDGDSLVYDFDNSWLSIDGQVVAYYYTDGYKDGDSYYITGYVPAYLNGERVELILVFDNDNPNGYIAGASTDYQGDVETAPKNLTEVKAGDQIDFICDYYSYDGTYQDSYYLGDTITLSADPVIGNIDIGDNKVSVTYRLTDIYQQHYWTPAITE